MHYVWTALTLIQPYWLAGRKMRSYLHRLHIVYTSVSKELKNLKQVSVMVYIHVWTVNYLHLCLIESYLIYIHVSEGHNLCLCLDGSASVSYI